jgi:hypothetical protein
LLGGVPATTGATSAPTTGPCGARRPVLQQIRPVSSDPPGCLDPRADLLFFLLCDDLPDGAVTFRKGVTPWLPFRRLESMVAPDWIPGLLVAC